MSKDSSISVGTFQDSIWIQIIGKGSFQNSSPLKSYCKQQCKDSTPQIVIDLGACTGMDSTFMGTLAGIALQIAKSEDPACSQLQIVEANERNQSALSDLGLDYLMEINPSDTPWENQIKSIRDSLRTWDAEGFVNTHLILEAHQKLCDADQRNKDKFDTVIQVLEEQAQTETNTDQKTGSS